MRIFRKTLFIAMCVLAACSNSNQTSQSTETFSMQEGIQRVFRESGIAQQIEALERGEMVDMDGDGFAEMSLTIDEEGARHLESITPEGNVDFYAVTYPDGSKHMLSDTNNDGSTDVQEDLVVQPQRKRIRLEDKDFDGYPEERRTTTYDYEQSIIVMTEERDDDMDGEYTIINQWTREIFKFDLPKEEAGHQKSYHPKTKSNPSTSGDIIGKCDSEQGEKLLRALDCFLAKRWTCLEEINKDWNKKLSELMSYLFFQGKLDIRCQEHEKYASYSSINEGFYVIGFDPNKAFEQCADTDIACQQNESDEQCSAMLHEFFHLADLPMAADHDTSQSDQIYACSRYCGFCRPWTHRPNVDCAICGGTVDEKLTCGFIEKYKEEPCYDSFDVCHAGLACISAACETCRILQIQTCDEQPAYEYYDRFYCCAACPQGCDSSNDFPCDSECFYLNTCYESAPHCPNR